jgi:hypothetical protein
MPSPNQNHSNNSTNNVVVATVRPSVAPPAAVVAAHVVNGVADGADENLTAGAGSITPPEETSWEKYSPNGEPIVGGLASALTHALVLVLLAFGIGWFFSGDDTPTELEGVEIGNGEEGGGGGNVNGIGDAPGNLTAPDQVKQLDQEKPQPTTPEEEVKVTKSAQTDDDFNKAFENKVKEKPSAVGPIIKDALEGIAGFGKGGNGRGGGEGNGVGRGRGDGVGDGTGKSTRRGRRVMRWEMVFNTTDAKNYLLQLDALGAVIAIPDRNAKLMTIRNIRERPAHPQYEDVKAMNRIFWTDDRRESCQSVAEELKLDIIPSVIVAFFPVELEQELLKKELAFRGRKEEDIAMTRFDIRFSGGKPAIKVLEQQPFTGHK